MKCIDPCTGIKTVGKSRFSYTYRCGKCDPCLIHRKLEWAGRIMLENCCHSSSVFVTLTYNEKYVPDDDNLDPADLTNFIKRFRKLYEKSYPTRTKASGGTGLRYFACGEYGGKFKRPHFHLIIFNLEPTTYNENLVAQAWSKCHDRRNSGFEQMGYITLAEITPGRAAYAADYSIKGLGTETRDDGRHPEFARMSRNPGLGHCMVNSFVDSYFKHGIIKKNEHADYDLQLNTAGIYRTQGRYYPIPRYFLTNIKNILLRDPRFHNEEREKLSVFNQLRDYLQIEKRRELSESFEQLYKSHEETFSEGSKEKRRISKEKARRITHKKAMRDGKK